MQIMIATCPDTKVYIFDATHVADLCQLLAGSILVPFW